MHLHMVERLIGGCVLPTAFIAVGRSAPAPAQSARGPFRAEYVVEVKDTAAKLFHVTATFRNVRQPQLELALPMWMPGGYRIRNYGKNVLRFAVTDQTGAPIAAKLSKPQTWTVDTRGKGQVVAEFDYRASVSAADEALVTNTYAFFTGAQLFLEPVGHRDVPSVVRFRAPAGWHIASALDKTSDSSVFMAPDYDALVDAPTWLGAFELHRFDVEGKAHYLVFEVSGRVPRFPPDSIAAAISRASSIIKAQSAIFGGLPYEKYLVFRRPGPDDSGENDTIEHGTSFVTTNTPDLESALDSHEFFHVWNVKRIRPAEMWPYDYSRPNVTPSLWFAEGVTAYYSDLTRYRASLRSDTAFLDAVARTLGVTTVDRSGRTTWNGARRYVSPSDASVASWLGESFWAYWLYYDQGEMLGALLDLSILHDTKGARGLDDVMRRLYREFYQRHRGFTPNDLIQVVSAVAGRDYSDFFRRFVTGVEVPPFDTVFGYAGLRVRPRYAGGIAAPNTAVDQGRRIDSVTPGGPAAAAGLRRGDIVVTVDGRPVNRFVIWCCSVVDDDGERVVLGVLRDGSHLEIPIALRRGPQVSNRFEFVPAPTSEQLTVRRAWLTRSPRAKP